MSEGDTIYQTRPIIVRDVFGQERPTALYLAAYGGRDGFACPFCQSVSTVAPGESPACENGWCNANPRMPVAVALDQAHDAALRIETEAKRKRDHEAAMRRIAEERESRDELWRANRERALLAGQCVRCASDTYRPRFVRHREGHAHRA